MENKQCPKCGSNDIMTGSLSASRGFTFIPDTQSGIVLKSSYIACCACKDCGAVFDLTLTDKPSKLTNR